MNIINYKTFLNLCSTENFSKTAEQMNVVQSTDSSRINELEKYLNISLFRRSKRNVEITDAGKLLVPFAKKIVKTENEVKELINHTDLYEDTLRINLCGSIYKEKLSPIINKFYNLYPQYALDIKIHKTNLQLEQLFENESDIGFISRYQKSSKVDIIPYLDFSLILIANNNSKMPDIITSEDLENINLTFNYTNDEFYDYIKSITFKSFRSRILINSTTQLIQYVLDNNGCAFVPSFSVENDLKAGLIRKIKISDIENKIFTNYIAINKKRNSSDILKKFLKLIPEYNIN